MATPAQLARIEAHVAALTERRVNVEPIVTRDRHRNARLTHAHRVALPGLLEQVEARFERGRTGLAESTGSAYGSRPPVALDCLAVHAQVTIAAMRWLWDHRHPQRDSVVENVRALPALARALDDGRAGDLAADLGRWRRWCEAAAGWTAPAYRPRCACPMPECARRDMIRVDLGAVTAVCLACGATWAGEAEIELLARWVRAANGEEAAT